MCQTNCDKCLTNYRFSLTLCQNKAIPLSRALILGPALIREGWDVLVLAVINGLDADGGCDVAACPIAAASALNRAPMLTVTELLLDEAIACNTDVSSQRARSMVVHRWSRLAVHRYTRYTRGTYVWCARLARLWAHVHDL